MVKAGNHMKHTKYHKCKDQKMYNTNIVIGSQTEDPEKKKPKCDVLAVYMPGEEIQSQLFSKQPKDCIDYRSYLPVYQTTTLPLRDDPLKSKHRQRKVLLGLLFAIIIVLFMVLGGTIGYGIYRGMF